MNKNALIPSSLAVMMTVVVFLAVILAPWKAVRGQLVQVQGRVTEVNPANRSVTVLDRSTSETVVLRLGRDAFEPGQSWKSLGKKPRVNVMATYNFDGSVQARRVVVL